MDNKISHLLIYLLLAGPFLLFSCQPAHEYDIIIEGGTIYDGSGETPYEGRVGIKGERIAAVGDFDGSARTTIDADGMAVAPGFINMLSWANVSLLH
ncbi:MAG: hypothetical protein R3222_05670, partial [Balneolaceae bacterium]|nr:hypothetical protein [Balneolaceae bacterium]